MHQHGVGDGEDRKQGRVGREVNKECHRLGLFLLWLYTLSLSFIVGTGLSGPKALNEDQLIDLWERIDARVEELMEGVEPLPRSHSPFNPASQVSVEEQK